MLRPWETLPHAQVPFKGISFLEKSGHPQRRPFLPVSIPICPSGPDNRIPSQYQPFSLAIPESLRHCSQSSVISEVVPGKILHEPIIYSKEILSPEIRPSSIPFLPSNPSFQIFQSGSKFQLPSAVYIVISPIPPSPISQPLVSSFNSSLSFHSASFPICCLATPCLSEIFAALQVQHLP